jgi:two-component system LytT family response regulator
VTKPRARVVIADDEPLARRRLRTLLASRPDFELVAECSDGREALQALRTLQPDVLLLDVQMPELSGVELMRLSDALPPVLVFVTAYDQYAVEAFEVHALDYLLKPYDEERFTAMMRRVCERLDETRSRAEHEKLLAFVESIGVARTTQTLPPLRIGDIDIDRSARRARRAGRLIVLRRREFDVLVRLAEAAGAVVSRKELLQEVWGYQDDVVSRTVDTHIFELRRKFAHQPGDAGYIETVSRVGYRILIDAEATASANARA